MDEEVGDWTLDFEGVSQEDAVSEVRYLTPSGLVTVQGKGRSIALPNAVVRFGLPCIDYAIAQETRT